MTQQSTRTLILTVLAVTFVGLLAYNGFFLALGQILQFLSLHM